MMPEIDDLIGDSFFMLVCASFKKSDWIVSACSPDLNLEHVFVPSYIVSAPDPRCLEWMVVDRDYIHNLFLSTKSRPEFETEAALESAAEWH